MLLCTFFVTSADAATFVLMLFTTNGLNMLQIMSIVGALPFSFVMAGIMVSTVKALKGEKIKS